MIAGSAHAYDGTSGYDRPDPGWYNQGSSAARAPDGYFADDRGSGWSGGRSDVDSWRGGAWDNRGDGGQRWSERFPGESARDYRDYGYVEPGYDTPERGQWRRDGEERFRDRYDSPRDQGFGRPNAAPDAGRPSDYGYAAPFYGDDFGERGDRYGRGGDAYGWGQPETGGGERWSSPADRPRYRFRDDPSLETRGRRDGIEGYDFRPLTKKERERRERSQPAFQEQPFPQREERYFGRDSGFPEPGAAFGYQPDFGAGSFYDRYYRSGP
jgi:hypothetical protein